MDEPFEFDELQYVASEEVVPKHVRIAFVRNEDKYLYCSCGISVERGIIGRETSNG